ncbi:protein translocase subunit SecF [Vibrio parahaemolyticus]
MNFVLIENVRNSIAKFMLGFAFVIALLFATGASTLNYSIEFTGGVVYTLSAPVDEVKDMLGDNSELNISGSSNGATVQMPEEVKLSEAELSYLEDHKLSRDTIGASLGQELVQASLYGIGFAFLGVMIYLSIRYNSTMAIATLIALVHDIAFTVFTLSVFGIEMSSIVVGALLAIIGYSINDSVVTLDRVRELIREDEKDPVQTAMKMTLKRNVNTAVSTLIVIASLFLFGGESMHAFSLTMLAGVGVGMFSSLTIVPFLVSAKRKSGAFAISKRPSLEGEL